MNVHRYAVLPEQCAQVISRHGIDIESQRGVCVRMLRLDEVNCVSIPSVLVEGASEDRSSTKEFIHAWLCRMSVLQ
jgi:hypothetical protein